VEESRWNTQAAEEATKLPDWLNADAGVGDGARRRLVNARQVTDLLLHLSTSSRSIEELFAKYASGSHMSLQGWLEFVATEQLGLEKDSSTSPSANLDAKHRAELASARAQFEKTFVQTEPSLLDYALMLLAPTNDAWARADRDAVEARLDAPIAHYWTTASHNRLELGGRISPPAAAGLPPNRNRLLDRS